MNFPDIKHVPRPQDLSFNQHKQTDKVHSSQPTIRFTESKSQMLSQSKRLELLTKINDLTKKVETVEMRLLGKLKSESLSFQTAGIKRLKPNSTSGCPPHPLILANLISAFYGSNSNAAKLSKKKFQKKEFVDPALNSKEPFTLPLKVRERALEVKRIPDQILLQHKRLPAVLVPQSNEEVPTKENLPTTNTIVNPVDFLKVPKVDSEGKKSSSVSINELQDTKTSGEKSLTDSDMPDELDSIPEHPAFGSVLMKTALDIRSRASKFSRMEINLVVERSAPWSKLVNAFRFIVALKKTYQESLQSRKSLCETFYHENYDFVLQSVVALIRKPIQDSVNQLLDIKKNFDVVSEVEVSRITAYAIISLRVG